MRIIIEREGMSVFSAVFVMLTTMMGSGVIMLPCAFRGLGYILGPVILIFLGFLSFFTLYSIGFATSKSETDILTYFNVCNKFSPILSYVADISFILQGTGCCFVYLTALKNWISLLFKSKNLALFLEIILMSIILILSIQKNLTRLRYVSIISVISTVYLAILMIYYYFKLKDYIENVIIIPFNTDFSLSLPIIIFSLGCHQNLVKIYSELNSRNLKTITIVSLISICLGSIIYTIIGLVGYILIGQNSKYNILEYFMKNQEILKTLISTKSWDKNFVLIKMALIAFIIVTVCSFPIQIQPARDAFLNIYYLLSKKNVIEMGRKKNEKDKLILSLILSTTLIFISWLIDLDLEKLIKFIGATVMNFVVYLFPSILYLFSVTRFKSGSIVALLISLFSFISMSYLIFFSK
ncbi:transmembrane amino acid transporter [Hamiltosporidium magnivora]|uniref:Transmembrane amino acid transporter n=1 Tax=Hamiltosporidium magnivora TaxID=148818 RepID=A0A4Q9LF63_9MICR|nr:transmembrane amino acid transporter [Hamiltosporidium magnivora]